MVMFLCYCRRVYSKGAFLRPEVKNYKWRFSGLCFKYIAAGKLGETFANPGLGNVEQEQRMWDQLSVINEISFACIRSGHVFQLIPNHRKATKLMMGINDVGWRHATFYYEKIENE